MSAAVLILSHTVHIICSKIRFPSILFILSIKDSIVSNKSELSVII